MEAGIHISAVPATKEIKSKNLRLLKKIFKYSMVLVESSPEDVKIVTKLKKKCRRINDHYLRSNEFSEFLHHLRKKIKRDTQNTFVYLKKLNDEVKCHSMSSNPISGSKCESTTPVITISDDSNSHDLPNNNNRVSKKIIPRNKKVDVFAESVILPKNVKPFHFPIVMLENIEKSPTKSHTNSKQHSRSKRGKSNAKNVQKRRILKRNSKITKKFNSPTDSCRTDFNMEQPLTSRRCNKSVETAEVISCVQKILEENNKSYYPIALIEDIKAHFNLGKPSTRQSKVSEDSNDTYVQKQQNIKTDHQSGEKFNFPIVKLFDCNTNVNLEQELTSNQSDVSVETPQVINGNHVQKNQNCNPFNSPIVLSKNKKTNFNLVQHSRSRRSNISVETIEGKTDSKDCKLVNSPIVLMDNFKPLSDLEHPSISNKVSNSFVAGSQVRNVIFVPEIRVSKRNSKDCKLVNSPTDLNDNIKTDCVATSEVENTYIKNTRASRQNSKDNSPILLHDNNKTNLNAKPPEKSRKLDLLVETSNAGNVCIQKTRASQRYFKVCNSSTPQNNSTHFNLEKSRKSDVFTSVSKVENICVQQRRASTKNPENCKPNHPSVLLENFKSDIDLEQSQVSKNNLKDCKLLNSSSVKTNSNLRQRSTIRNSCGSAETSDVKKTPSKNNSNDSTFNFPITVLEDIKTHVNLGESSPSKQLNGSVESTNDKNICVQKKKISKRNSNNFNFPTNSLRVIRTRSNSEPGLSKRQLAIKMSQVRKKHSVKKR